MSTGGRVFPSITGGGLTRAGEAIFQAALARSSRDLQERQLGIAEQANAMNQFTALAGFLPPGSRLGDLGTAGMNLFARAFSVPGDGLEDLELNPETLETVLDSRGRGILEANPELLLPSIRSRLGLEPDQDVAETRGLQARMQFEALSSITSDPALKSEFVSRALGREPITLIIPGRDGAPDRTTTFASPTAATIYAQFLLAQDRERFELSIRPDETSTGLITEIQKAVNEAGVNVSSTAIQGRVIPTYNRAVQAGDLSLITTYLDSASEGEALAMQYLLGSIKAGEETFLDQLRQQAPALANFIEIGNAVREVLGPEQAAEVLPGITEALGGVAGTLSDPLFGGLRFEFEGTTDPDAARGSMLPGLGNVPRETLITVAKNLFQDGTQTREELIAGLGADVVNAALGAETSNGTAPAAAPSAIPVPTGGYDPNAVPASVKRQATQLNMLLERGRSSGGMLGRGVQTTIERLQREVRTAINLPDANLAVDVVTLQETKGGIPAGGINPDNVPPGAREDVTKLNELVRRRARVTDARSITALDVQITRQRQRVSTIIAGIGGK